MNWVQWVAIIGGAIFCAVLAYDAGRGKGHGEGYHEGFRNGNEMGYKAGIKKAKGYKPDPDPVKELGRILQEEDREKGFLD